MCADLVFRAEERKKKGGRRRRRRRRRKGKFCIESFRSPPFDEEEEEVGFYREEEARRRPGFPLPSHISVSKRNRIEIRKECSFLTMAYEGKVRCAKYSTVQHVDGPCNIRTKHLALLLTMSKDLYYTYRVSQ